MRVLHRFIGKIICDSIPLIGSDWRRPCYAIPVVIASAFSSREVDVRDRVHMLVVGPPGTGKTDLLLSINEAIPDLTVFADAPYITQVGLIGSSRGGYYTPGLLYNADGMILLIDELDKMPSQDQNGLLQAMEEGSYSIYKAGVEERIEAEVTVIATANRTRSIRGGITPPLLDRMDLVYHVRPPSRDERLRNLRSLLDKYDRRYRERLNRLNRYIIAYMIKQSDGVEPHISDKSGVMAIIEEYINSIDVSSKSVRSLELSILRIARAIAIVNRTDIDPLTIAEAIYLKDTSLGDEVIKKIYAEAAEYTGVEVKFNEQW